MKEVIPSCPRCGRDCAAAVGDGIVVMCEVCGVFETDRVECRGAVYEGNKTVIALQEQA